MLSPPSKSVVLFERLYKFLEMCRDAKELHAPYKCYFLISMPGFYLLSSYTLEIIIVDELKYYKAAII